jgi:hypothetical protein
MAKKRKPGRPKKNEKVITPAKQEVIAKMWLRGATMSSIADVLKVDKKTVSYHLKHTIKPMWKEELSTDLGSELAKVSEVERVAWECFEASQGNETKKIVKERLMETTHSMELAERITSNLKREGSPAWIDVIRWCLDFRAKIAGHYAPTRMEVDDFRVAGKEIGEVDQEMMKRLATIVKERRDIDLLKN